MWSVVLHALRWWPKWDAQVWFDCILAIFTAVEACALVMIYRLEKSMEKARTDVSVLAIITRSVQQEWSGAEARVVNASESGCLVSALILWIGLENATKHKYPIIEDDSVILGSMRELPAGGLPGSRGIYLGGLLHRFAQEVNVTTEVPINLELEVEFFSHGHVQVAWSPEYRAIINTNGLVSRMFSRDDLKE